MTNTQDTAPEAVERLHEEIHGMKAGPALFEGQQEYVRYEDYAALSAALEAEKSMHAKTMQLGDQFAADAVMWKARAETAEAARDKWRSMWEKEQTHNEELSAERDALKAELAEAVQLLVSAEIVMQFALDHEASELDRRLTIKDAMSAQKEILAFLARQKETDT